MKEKIKVEEKKEIDDMGEQEENQEIKQELDDTEKKILDAKEKRRGQPIKKSKKEKEEEEAKKETCRPFIEAIQNTILNRVDNICINIGLTPIDNDLKFLWKISFGMCAERYNLVEKLLVHPEIILGISSASIVFSKLAEYQLLKNKRKTQKNDNNNNREEGNRQDNTPEKSTPPTIQ